MAFGLWPLALTAACTQARARDLVIAAGPLESSQSCVARALVVALNASGADDRASVLRTAGAIDSLEALREQRADLAISAADVLAEAVNGQGVFAGKTVTARTIATLYVSALHLVVPRGSPINGFSQLRDHAVGTAGTHTGTELVAMRALRAALLDRRVTTRAIDPQTALSGLDSGVVDAFFWLDGVPSPLLLAGTRQGGAGFRLLSTASVVPLLQRRHGETLYEVTRIPGTAYGTVDATDMVGVSDVLVARHDIPDASAYDVTRAIFAHAAELIDACPAARGLNPERAARSQPAALHAGAARYYRQVAPR